jgi:hypothetical protein
MFICKYSAGLQLIVIGALTWVPWSRVAGKNIDPAVHFEIIEMQNAPVIDRDHPDAQGNKFGFEGGSAIKVGGTYHLMVFELVGEPAYDSAKMAHWTSQDALHWKRISTLFEVQGKPGNLRIPCAPMPVFNKKTNHWELFYVVYRPLNSANGRVWRAVSTVAGRDGIDGPYQEIEAILQPDQNSQKWEGAQGVDSFFPYSVNGAWYGLYGSSDADSYWSIGLAHAPALQGPWSRVARGNPLSIEPLFIENPIVTKVGDSYLAVYDADVVGAKKGYHKEAHSVGYTWSADGIHWAHGKRITVQPAGPANWAADIRTPLGLIPEGNDIFTLFYTGWEYVGQGKPPTSEHWDLNQFWESVGMVRLRAMGLKVAEPTGQAAGSLK